ncbi:Cytochrome P450 4c3 [Carabus blaptoides fortunei]
MSLFYLLLLFTLFFLSLIYLLRNYKEWKRLEIIDQLPGPKRRPLIGTVWELLTCPRRDLFNLFMLRISEYKPLFRTWSGSVPEVHIMKPEHLEIVMNNTKHINKGQVYKFLLPWLGRGLLTSTGNKWHSRRKMLTPTFHFYILENFFTIFRDISGKLVDKLVAKADGGVFDIYPYITHCTLDIICETAMGVELNALDKSNSEYVSAIYEISELTFIRLHRPWLHNDFIFYNLSSYGKRYKRCVSVLHGFTKKVIKERTELYNSESLKRKELNKDASDIGKKKRMAFLDLLIEASENGLKLNEYDIREEVDTFMFEVCIDVQNKVVAELADIFQGEDRPITVQDLTQMKYLERVIKETLRLYPSVPFISRALTEDIVLDGYVIPRGCMTNLHIHDVHRDPTQFPNPEMFDPDNFLPERCQHRHPYAYIPFSAGPRNCIGQKFAIMEEKTILASILRKYMVHSVQKPSEIRKLAELILRPEGGVLVKLEPRK